MTKRRLIIDAMPLSVPRISGVGHSTWGFIHALTQDRRITDTHDIILVTTTRGLEFVKQWNFQNVQYRALPLPYRVFNRLPGTPLMPFMDLILGRGTYLFPNFRSWPLLRSRSLTIVHDVAFLLHPEFVAPRNRAFLASHVPVWAKRSTAVGTVSTSSKAEIIEALSLSEDKVKVVYNGVDTAVFQRQSPEAVQAIKAKYHLPDNFILYLGNIEPRKNITTLVRAYAALPASLRQAHPLVLIGGSGWLSEDIDAEIDRARAAGNTIVRPDQYVTDDDLPAIYTAASALAHPAIHEGFGFSPLQSMACGLPVLVSNIPPIVEVVGDAGLYVDPHDETDITRKLEQILTDDGLRAKLTAAGLDQSKKFSWSAGVGELVDWILDQQ